MEKVNIKKLLKKYKDNTCTPEELALLETWYLQWKGEKNKKTPEQLEKLKKEVWLAISSETNKPKVIYRWFRVAAAASVVLFLSLGIYFFFPMQENGGQLSHDIQPGGNKAILKLADGTTLVLDTLNSGKIAEQKNAEIVKLEDGKLLFAEGISSGDSSFREVASETPSFADPSNVLSTPRGGQYQLTLSDGTKVWLNSNSSIFFPATFIGKERRVNIQGECYFEVAKNDQMPFIVNVNNKTEVKVLGTHFNISAYEDEPTIKTTLLEGSVQLLSLQPGEQENIPLTLKPGQQAILEADGNITLIQVNTALYAAWKDGRLAFKDEALEEILKRMSRWYDFEVVYADASVKALCFTGNIERKAEIQDVLTLLEKTKRVKFIIEHKTITIMNEP